MADLAQACGLLKGSFYHYFANKEILAKEALGYTLEFFREKVFKKAYQTDFPASKRLAKILEIEYSLVSPQFQGCLFGNIALETEHQETEFSPIIQLFFNELQEACVFLWQEKVLPTEAQIRAQMTIAQLQGGIMLMKIYKDTQKLLDVIDHIQQNFDASK
jgi:TetR/AcrR family transcriptional repressor of nem operon